MHSYFLPNVPPFCKFHCLVTCLVNNTAYDDATAFCLCYVMFHIACWRLRKWWLGRVTASFSLVETSEMFLLLVLYSCLAAS